VYELVDTLLEKGDPDRAIGSLLQLAELEPHERMRPMRVALPDGRMGSAYAVEPRRVAPAGAA